MRRPPMQPKQLKRILFDQAKRACARWLALATLALLLTAAALAGGNLPVLGQFDPAAKTNLPADLTNVYDRYESDVIEIKFRDDITMRLREGVPQNANAGVAAAEVEAVLTLSAGGTWERSHTTDEAALDEMRRNGEARTGKPLPDLNNYVRLELPPGQDAVAAVQAFAALSTVEAAYLIPKPVAVTAAPVGDYANPGNITGNPITDAYQGYLDKAPNGVDARWAWDGVYGSGAGIRICDVEYDYNANHKDLPNVTDVGDPKDPPFSDDHGAAVLSIMGGLDNGWGVKGIAYGASYSFAAAKTTTGGYDVGAGVIECVNKLNTGDVIIIEQQTSGPNASGSGQFGLVPVEWYEPWYDDIVTAVANGMVVVEAGGNGSQDLDSSDYQTGNGGHYPFKSGNDSGAIIVGAGKSPKWGANARSAESFSSYGSTVDIQGWGDGIVSAGYGDLYPGGSTPDSGQKNLWYREAFGGTSGASPIVAASAAIVQANYKAKNGSAASPAQIKQILQSTGTAQTGSKKIGPLPNLRAAVQQVWGVNPATVAAPTISPGSGSYAMPMQVTIAYGSGSQNSGNTHIRYTLDGSEPTIDSFIFIPEQGDQIYLNYGATVKAKAFQSDVSTGLVNSSETSVATYQSSTPKAATPVINPGGGFYSQPHQVTLTTATSGATIKYRTDGRSPSFFYPGTEYTGPITLAPGEYRIKARAYKDGYYKSDVADSGDIVVSPTTLPAPTIYPNGGNFAGAVTVYIGSTVLGAEIRYTTDGSTPSQSSPLFTEPIALTQSGTVKARIYLDGYTPSPVTSATFDVTQQVATPVITPNGGTGTGSLQVSLSTATPGATIRYTTNGAEPTTYSTEYAGPFSLGVGLYTVKAKAFLEGATASATASADFVVYTTNQAQVEAPVIDPDGGNHTGAITVTLTTDTEGADIYYILDSAAEPNVLYTGPITLQPRGNTYSFRARAKKMGMTDSNISTTSFTIFDPSLTGQIEDPDVTPSSGTYDNTFQVTVDGHTNPPFKIRQVYVTTNGEDPMPNSNASNHSSPYSFTVSKSMTVKAIATQLGWTNSNVVTREYILKCGTPAMNSAGGTYTGSVSVAMSTSTSNATIRYTTDGSEPTSSSSEYTSPLTLGVGTHTIKAKCFRSNFEDSETATEVYLVNEPPVAPQIITHPVDKTVDVGMDATFSVDVSGEPDPAIRWQKDGVDIAGETEPELGIADAQPGNAGQYQAVVANSAGEVTSNPATLTVNGTPTPTPTSTTTSPTATPTATPTPTATSTPTGGGTSTDVAINEVYYKGGIGQDWVEIVNTGSDIIDISDWWLCARFQYGQISTLTLLAGSDYILSPGEKLVVQAHADLDDNASDLGLYTTNDFANPDAMVDFVQWGTDQDVGRSDVAVAKGVWRELAPGQYDFVPTAGSGQSAAWQGTNSGGGLLTFSNDWENGIPTQGGPNDGPTPTPTPTTTPTPGGPTPTPTSTLTPGTPTPTSTPGAPGSDTDVAINEVYYKGDAGGDWVEIVNTGTSVIDISNWWLCARFQYGQINTLALLSGNDYVLGPGETLVVRAHANLDDSASDLGLYTTPDFANPDAMVDFVQWGTDQDVGRSDVAAAKGVWRELTPGQYDFAPTAGSGQSAAWKGTNSGGGLLTHSEDWSNGTPTQGGSNSGGSSSGDKRVFLPVVTR